VLRTADLEYELPERLIATLPAEPRDSARMLVVSRSDGARLEHRRVSDLPGLLRAGDLLVFNDTRVVPARFLGVREDTKGRVEGLYLGPGPEDGTWEVLLKTRRFKEGAPVALTDGEGRPIRIGEPSRGIVLTLLRRAESGSGGWIVRAESAGAGGRRPVTAEETLSVLGRAGLTPIPPYIRAARKAAGLEVGEETDRERYQTVYAAADLSRGASVAAPTAGLHFTPDLLARLGSAGIGRADVTLHVGTGTFKPVEVEHVEGHPMHAEWCSMSAGAGAAVRGAKERGRRVVTVGTTSARTVETYAGVMEEGGEIPGAVMSRLLVTPGYSWRVVDGMLTNFHLPRSTLMAMVAALLPGGVPRLKEIYAEAVKEGYRFYSYGDAMLILP
jgi:S-adenosylmethionine:tRNA ribosyltransferase-isomerase